MDASYSESALKRSLDLLLQKLSLFCTAVVLDVAHVVGEPRTQEIILPVFSQKLPDNSVCLVRAQRQYLADGGSNLDSIGQVEISVFIITVDSPLAPS